VGAIDACVVKVEMRLLSLKLTDLHLLSYQPASSTSGKMIVEGLKTMVEIGERLMARLRRGRSWDACMMTRTTTATLTASRKFEILLLFRFHVYDHVIITYFTHATQQ
jgi:hypothetical protein